MRQIMSPRRLPERHAPLQGLLLVLCSGLFVSITHAEEPAKTSLRDWKRFPAIVEVDTEQEIYALGDVHGDYERLVSLLLAAKIIAADPAKPEAMQWSAGKSILVCLGDMIDKGDHSYHVLVALRALRVSADQAGGQVILLSGNHEAEFIAGDGKNKKAAEFIKELKAKDIKPEDVAAGKDDEGIGEMLRTLPFAARVNDWFFAHAGNTHGLSLKKLRSDIEEGINKDGFKADVLQNADSLLLARSNQPSPWWEKEGEKPEAGEERLREFVKELGVKHLVVGHVPGKVTFADQTVRPAGEIYHKFDGMIFFIDVGMSRAVAQSTGAILHIRGEHAGVIVGDGSRTELWGK